MTGRDGAGHPLILNPSTPARARDPWRADRFAQIRDFRLAQTTRPIKNGFDETARTLRSAPASDAEVTPLDSVAVADRYPLPLYLNQKYVFDVLSMMERGLTQLESVTTTMASTDEASRNLGAGVGVSNAFGLLSVSLGGARAGAKSSHGAHQVEAQRVHTPNSLFARMRERLFEEGLVSDSLDVELAAGDWLETTMRFEKNPVLETLETLVSFLKMAAIFEDPTPAQRSSGGRSRGQQQRQGEIGTRQMLQQMTELVEELQSGEVVDLIGSATAQATRPPSFVVTLDVAYASDPLLAISSTASTTFSGRSPASYLLRLLRGSISFGRQASVGSIRVRWAKWKPRSLSCRRLVCNSRSSRRVSIRPSFSFYL